MLRACASVLLMAMWSGCIGGGCPATLSDVSQAATIHVGFSIANQTKATHALVEAGFSTEQSSWGVWGTRGNMTVRVDLDPVGNEGTFSLSLNVPDEDFGGLDYYHHAEERGETYHNETLRLFNAALSPLLNATGWQRGEMGAFESSIAQC